MGKALWVVLVVVAAPVVGLWLLGPAPRPEDRPTSAREILGACLLDPPRDAAGYREILARLEASKDLETAFERHLEEVVLGRPR